MIISVRIFLHASYVGKDQLVWLQSWTIISLVAINFYFLSLCLCDSTLPSLPQHQALTCMFMSLYTYTFMQNYPV